MKQAFIPLFQDIRTSSLWALDSDTPGALRVWITLLTLVDSKGYVCAALPGIAIAACLPLDVVRRCIEVFESPDPYSRTTDHEGRRLEKVDRGWRVLTYEAMVERARHESRKASKRNWARGNYAEQAANDVAPTPSNDVAPRLGSSNSGQKDENLDPIEGNLDRSRSRSRSHFSEEVIPPTPQAPPPPPPVASQQSRHGVLTELPDDYVPSEALRMAATLAGVKRLDHWIAKLKMKPIGGQSGIRADKLEAWLVGLVAEWRKWEETDSFKDGNSRSGAGSGSRFQGGQAPSPTARRERVQGAPDWVYVEHDKFARREGLNLNRAARAFEKGYHLPVKSLHGTDLFTPFMKYLENLARSKEASA